MFCVCHCMWILGGGVALVGKYLYWALLTPSWVNVFQVLEVYRELKQVQRPSIEKGRIVVYSHLLYCSGPNVQFYDVNNKFCKKKKISSNWFSVAFIFPPDIILLVQIV